MPHTPASSDDGESDHSKGEFADLFARKTRTPLRGFLPGRRVWNAVGGSAAAVLVIAGSATALAAIDWNSGSDAKVTTAADRPAEEKSASGDTKKADAVPSPKEQGKGKADPGVGHLPVSGGAGPGAGAGPGGGTSTGMGTGTGTGGGAQSPQDTGSDAGSTGTTGTTGGSSGSTGTQENNGSTTQNTESRPTADYLWADGGVDTDSNDYWDQSTLTVKSTTSLTGLKVVVRIAQTGGVAHTGFWSSLGDRATFSQAVDGKQLAYVVTLKPGVTLGAGTYTFQFQYNHDQGGRSAGGDRYNVSATSSGSVDEYRAGSF